MSRPDIKNPLTRSQAIELYFMEHRAKLIDIAAFLDRTDRAEGKEATEDFRLAAFRKAMAIVADGKPQRAKRVLELFSDPTMEPVAKAGMKGALGAYQQPSGKDGAAR